jgi:YesN/AraC family two-component response regulator
MNNLKNMSVLYVEDSRLMRNKIEMLLEGKVRELYFANDGQEGLEAFKEFSPDIIVADIDMPVMDGFVMSEIIRKIEPSQSIAFLTSFENTEFLKKAIDLGIDSFISKPIDGKKFLKILKNLSETVQNKRDLKRLEKIKHKKEKVELMLKFVKEISHHWRQPLATISASATSSLLKKEMGEASIEDLQDNMEVILKNIEKLSNILVRIEKIDVDDSNVEEVEDIVKISNPIYS